MVFKRLAERIVSAGTSVATQLSSYASDAEKVRRLEGMGFDPARARHALNATEGDVERAAELLLLSHQDGGSSSGAGTGAAARTAPERGRGGGGARGNGIGGGGEVQGAAVAAHNDEQMRRAMEDSLQVAQGDEERRMRQAQAASMDGVTGAGKKGAATTKKKAPPSSPNRRTPPSSSPPRNRKPTQQQPRTAAQRNAGKAAAVRLGGGGATIATGKSTLDATHPAVKLPDRMADKTKEEQILRCADRLKSHSMAVDTLLRALNAVRNRPDEAKFRTIDRSNGNYVKFVRDKPGAEDMFLAANYRKGGANYGDKLILERHLVDDALLYLSISALEQARKSPEYLESKRWRAFHAEAKRIADMALRADETGGGGGMTEEETAVRIGFLSKCPTEPPEGRGARLTVVLGDYSKGDEIQGGTIARRFDGDDTLDDALHWMGGRYGSELLDRIRSREFCLCDLNRYPIFPLDVERHGKKTLQYLGCFPSGKLGVRPSDESWKEGKGGAKRAGGIGGNVAGSTRGLGAASRSMLEH